MANDEHLKLMSDIRLYHNISKIVTLIEKNLKNVLCERVNRGYIFDELNSIDNLQVDYALNTFEVPYTEPCIRLIVFCNNIFLCNIRIDVPLITLSSCSRTEQLLNLSMKLSDDLANQICKLYGVLDAESVDTNNSITPNRKPILCSCCGSPLEPPFNHCKFCGVFYEG